MWYLCYNSLLVFPLFLLISYYFSEISVSDSRVININSEITIKEEENSVDRLFDSRQIQFKASSPKHSVNDRGSKDSLHCETFLMTDVTIPDVQLHEVDEEINCSEEYEDDVSQVYFINPHFILLFFYQKFFISNKIKLM